MRSRSLRRQSRLAGSEYMLVHRSSRYHPCLRPPPRARRPPGLQDRRMGVRRRLGGHLPRNKTAGVLRLRSVTVQALRCVKCLKMFLRCLFFHAPLDSQSHMEILKPKDESQAGHGSHAVVVMPVGSGRAQDLEARSEGRPPFSAFLHPRRWPVARTERGHRECPPSRRSSRPENGGER